MEKFSELKYVRPDMEQLKSQINLCLDKMEQASDYAQFRDAYIEMSKINGNFEEMATISNIRNTMNKADEFYDAEQNFFDEEIPKLMSVRKRTADVMLATPFRKQFDDEFGKMIILGHEKARQLLDERLVPLQIEENKLSQEYSMTVAKCKCNFRGEECNFYGLLAHMQSTDRTERKEAFEAWAGLYEGVSEKLDAIFDRLVSLRLQKAEIVGLPGFREFSLTESGHYDYTKADLANFKKQVVDIIVPEAAKLYAEQAKRLGLERLEWYDESLVFPDGNAKPQGSKDEMVSRAQDMYKELSPETGEFFEFMTKYELFDLETRPNKHLGGYMTILPVMKAPFIFSNFNGTSADVEVLTHEAGHAFEGYIASRVLPLSELIFSTSDICEIHSMTMEHLTYPWMDKFFGEKADRFRYSHLTEAIKVIPYLCAVDEFQCRVFEEKEISAKKRYEIWKDVEKTFLPWRHYDGNEFLEKGGFWMQKQHIFLYPFYYIDYALAQLGAFELYGKTVADRNEGWNDYLSLCKLGGSKGYLELLEAANIHNPFKDGSVKAAVDGVLKQIKEFERRL